jgi:hypothetical protein
MVASLSPRVAAVDPNQQAALDMKIEAARASTPPIPPAPLRLPRIEHVSPEQIAVHPHGLLLALVQNVLFALRQATQPCSADPDAFARQMEVFERMRETERAFRQSKEVKP